MKTYILLNNIEVVRIYKFLTHEEKKEILKSRIEGNPNEIKERLTKVDNTEVLIIPFNKLNHFTYKYRKKLILHYPSKKVLSNLMIKCILKKKLPMIGIILINNKNDIVPFAECIIKNIFIPSELSDIWNQILKKKEIFSGKTLYQIYKEYFKCKLVEENSSIDNVLKHFLVN